MGRIDAIESGVVAAHGLREVYRLRMAEHDVNPAGLSMSGLRYADPLGVVLRSD
ncbi:hypothetical protein SAMN04490239_6047 [Rhodococcus koreensis]|uniref:Uncharacterized protein n=1 Tax=Rhodococcus koreensis TaxID=99653 RepID=A0A1H4WJN8_9NOCA|nr:hypothetical protein SAMN04490239_6047 [Rhodococcus koreensis]